MIASARNGFMDTTPHYPQIHGREPRAGGSGTEQR
jgi:hypothetical protein